MKKIGFVGVPGTGKTSLARGVASKAYEKIGNVELVAEYARRFISKYGDIQNIADQYKILQKQIEWEEIALTKQIDVLITESPIYIGFLYAMEKRDLNSVKDTMYINDIFKKMNKLNCPPRYDIIFHLPPLWIPSKDGVRPEKHFLPEWREEADKKIQFIFKLFPPKNFVIIKKEKIEGRIEECLSKCIDLL
jgi:nicotinamide riboside kinase